MRHHAMPVGSVTLDGGVFERRRALNQRYLASLSDDNLLQNFRLEAAIQARAWHLEPSGDDPALTGRDRHWGWESPGAELRGHFLGHWMSAAAREAATTGDPLLRTRVLLIVRELQRCQEENGGEWVFAIPPKYLDRLASGRQIWAPQYNIHKTLMGLVDVYKDLGDPTALDVAVAAARWLARWSDGFSSEEFAAIIDVETGGMLEVWADLLEATGDEVFTVLLQRYYHARLFDRLLDGIDVLTNMHANTTIPEVLGAARAFEVTGDTRWRRIVEAYWHQAVVDRGTFCTGGQTSGEIWTPPFEFAARRGPKNQEHCTVYNMIRLADVLFRWTGEVDYLDYIERNLYNGILAQQNALTGMVAYFLPLDGGAIKKWGSPTEDFWCCHGTLVQAHTRHAGLVFYGAGEERASGVTIAQYMPATLTTDVDGIPLSVRVEVRDTTLRAGPDANAGEAGSRRRPSSWGVVVTVRSDDDVTVPIRLRIPEWVDGAPSIVVGDSADGTVETVDGFATVIHTGTETVVELTLPHTVRSVPIPDEPETVAFVEGPIVLAGLCSHEVALRGDPDHPERVLVPHDERQWTEWLRGFRTVGQDIAIRFRPLHEITDQSYSVYFPVVSAR